MKTKSLMGILGIAVVLLCYFLFCNHLVNKAFKEKTEMVTAEYARKYYPDANWKYIKAVPNDKNSFWIEIELEKDDKTFKEKIKYDYKDFF